MKTKVLGLSFLVLVFGLNAFGQARPESVQKFSGRVRQAFMARDLARLDAGKVGGSIRVSVEHSIADGTDVKSFTNFKQAEKWLMRSRKDANLVAKGTIKCRVTTCTIAPSGMLHNTLYLRKITYGYVKGRPYVRAIHFVDGD